MNTNIKHFILTRFNIKLWSKDKQKKSTQTDQWLEERFNLFERFCLPSIKNQNCKNFIWIVLFDADTPQFYKEKIEKYKKEYPQLNPCMVSAKDSQNYIFIYQNEIRKHLDSKDSRIITTYLDNDDSLYYDFITKVQEIALHTSDKTFISFNYGLQYFVQLNIATKILYKNNHFISFIENCSNPDLIKTVQGYGSHFYIDKYKETQVAYIDLPEQEAWIEIIHNSNVDNDVKMTFDTKLIKNPQKLLKEYGIDIKLSSNSTRIFLTQFIYRVFKQILRRTKDKIIKKKWE